MKTTPYELVFGQPPRQNIFPGVHGTTILEEDVEDIIQNEEKEQSHTDSQQDTKLKSQDPDQHHDSSHADPGLKLVFNHDSSPVGSLST